MPLIMSRRRICCSLASEAQLPPQLCRGANPVENLIRPLTLNCKNSLFTGHDEAAQNWARLASPVATCKLNGVEPFAYMKTTFEALAAKRD